MVLPLVFKENFLSFRDYARVSLRYTLKAKPFTYILVLPLVSLVAFWCVFPWKDITLSTLWQNTGAYVWLMTLLIVATPFTTWRGLKKNYQAARFMQSPADYEFSDAGMNMKSAVTQIQMAWEAFHTFYSIGRYGVLLSGNNAGFFLDFDSLQSPAVKQDFVNLLVRRNIPVK